MKTCLAALTLSVVMVGQEAQAQSTNAPPADTSGVMMGTAGGANTNSPESPPVFVTKIPRGYRDWKLVSVAHEEGKLNDIRAILGNNRALKTYREGTLPFPDGAIIARLVAGGRTPNTDGIGLDKAGVATTNRGHVKVKAFAKAVVDVDSF